MRCVVGAKERNNDEEEKNGNVVEVDMMVSRQRELEMKMMVVWLYDDDAVAAGFSGLVEIRSVSKGMKLELRVDQNLVPLDLVKGVLFINMNAFWFIGLSNVALPVALSVFSDILEIYGNSGSLSSQVKSVRC